MRRNVYFPDAIDELITEYMERTGMSRSQICQRGAVLIIKGVVDVPLMGKLHARTDFDEIKRRLDAAKDQSDE